MKPFIQPVFPPGCVVWYGHRGAAAVRPENTLVSFRAAQEVGASMIELDIQQVLMANSLSFMTIRLSDCVERHM
jgi:hypothetical protein